MNVRYWHKADIPTAGVKYSLSEVKADTAWTYRNDRL